MTEWRRVFIVGTASVLCGSIAARTALRDVTEQQPVKCPSYGALQEVDLFGLATSVSAKRFQQYLELCGLGVDVTPTLEENLRAAGADTRAVAAIRQADWRRIESGECPGPFGLARVTRLIEDRVGLERSKFLLSRCGIGFTPTDETDRTLLDAGADSRLLEAVRDTFKRKEDSARRELMAAIEDKARESLARDIVAGTVRRPPRTYRYRVYHVHSWTPECDGELAVTGDGLSFESAKHTFKFANRDAMLKDCSGVVQTLCVTSGGRTERFIFPNSFIEDVMKAAETVRQ